MNLWVFLAGWFVLSVALLTLWMALVLISERRKVNNLIRSAQREMMDRKRGGPAAR